MLLNLLKNMETSQLWTILTPIMATIVISVFAWLLKRAIENLEKTDQRIETKVDKIESFTKSSANSIVEIQTLLAGKGYTIQQRLAYTSGSPLKLTDYGETMMKESGFHENLIKNKKFFVDLVRNKKPLTNYDIQDYSMLVLKELASQNNPIVIPLKNYAFDNGLPLEIILNSAGIVLRDEVMKEVKFSDSTLDTK